MHAKITIAPKKGKNNKMEVKKEKKKKTFDINKSQNALTILVVGGGAISVSGKLISKILLNSKTKKFKNNNKTVPHDKYHSKHL